MNDPDFVVESLHESKGHFMIGTAITDDAFPMALDQSDKLLVRLEAAPLELGLPVLKELSSPGGILIIPELSEGFFEHIGFAQALIGLEQQRQGAPAVQIEISFMRQKRIALSFDEAFVFGGDPGIFPPPHLVKSLRQMLEHMELVEDDFGLRRMGFKRVAERLPHVHHRQAQRAVPLGAHIVEESVHVLLSAAQLLAHPDRPLLIQVCHHDGVTLAFADRDFINADGPQAFPGQMLGPKILHVIDIHAPNLVPTEMMEFGDLLDGHRPAEASDLLFEPLGETSRFGQPCQSLPFHPAAHAAVHSPNLEFQVNPSIPGIQVAHPMSLAVVEASRGLAA